MVRRPLAITLVSLLVGVTALCLLLTGCGGKEGSFAPSFSGTTIDGQQVSLESLRGRPLVLAFWGSW